MKVAGIIAEYNPFHNGHAFHIDSVYQNGATHIVAVMSGNFVQRGEGSVFDKWARTETALKNGVDLVVELPTQYATATAERFALGAVNTLNALGCVDELAFGSECGDIDLLTAAAEANLSADLDEPIKQGLESGKSYAAARCDAVKRLYGKKVADLFCTPNDTLGIEYISSLIKSNSKITPYVIKRHKSEHDKVGVADGFASASQIRQMILRGEDFSHLVPDSAYEIYKSCIEKGTAPATLSNAQSAILWQLRQMSSEDFAELFDMSEGLPYRLYNAVQKATTLDEVYELAKTKRYPLARIRRLVLWAVLGSSMTTPEYIRVLGFNKKGSQLLKLMKTTCALPVVTSYSGAVKSGNQADFEVCSKQTDFYTLTLPKPLPCGEEMRRSVVKI
ncbi:MAG: nucleotidyltransferase family protein [Clostridia bacterium]|nr:nucleotidyltransferase family protein [Clostridia bacterium]